MLQNTLISICILNYNGEKRLPKSIPSILSQDYPHLEFLFLDNGSTDKSLDYISQFKEIRIIKSNTNLGISGGRNKLAKLTKGKYILFIDNDIELPEKDFISKIFLHFQKVENLGAGVIFPISETIGYTYVYSTGLYFNKLQKKKIFHDVYKKGLLIRPGFSGESFFIRKKIFEELGGFDEKYPFNMDDYDLSAKLYNTGYSIYLDTNLYVIHHGIDTRFSGKSIGWKNQFYFCGFTRMMIKNYLYKNLIKRGIISIGWIFVKTLKQTIKYKSIYPLIGTIKSIRTFFKDLPDTLKERKYWQNNRKTDRDIFLEIK